MKAVTLSKPLEKRISTISFTIGSSPPWCKPIPNLFPSSKLSIRLSKTEKPHVKNVTNLSSRPPWPSQLAANFDHFLSILSKILRWIDGFELFPFELSSWQLSNCKPTFRISFSRMRKRWREADYDLFFVAQRWWDFWQVWRVSNLLPLSILTILLYSFKSVLCLAM